MVTEYLLKFYYCQGAVFGTHIVPPLVNPKATLFDFSMVCSVWKCFSHYHIILMNALIVSVSQHHADIYHPVPTHNPYQACLLSFSLSPLTYFLTRLLLLRALQPLHLHRGCKHGGLRGLQTQHSWPTVWKVQERLPQKWVCQTGWCKCMHRSVFECGSHARKKFMHGGDGHEGVWVPT